LTLLLENTDSAEFRQPVDYKALGILDYPDIITYPMDLGSVKRKLAKNYKYVEDCLDDIQMIWDNCKRYNAVGSWIYKLADKLDKYYMKLLKNYLPNISNAFTTVIT